MRGKWIQSALGISAMRRGKFLVSRAGHGCHLRTTWMPMAPKTHAHEARVVVADRSITVGVQDTEMPGT
ncbi:hypothetical protein PG995_010886 [Apiospora arundinis]